MVDYYFKCVLIILLAIIISSCNSGGEGDSGSSNYFMPSLPDNLISTTYKSEITWGGNISGNDFGSIDIFNELTGESTTAQIVSKEKCYWAIWFIILIPVDFCVTDFTYVATVPLDIGPNLITVTATDVSGDEVISKSYSIERLDLIQLKLSDLQIEGAEFDKQFQPDITEYSADVCFNTTQIRLTPIVSDEDLRWYADKGTLTNDEYLDVILNEGLNKITLTAFVDSATDKFALTNTVYTININRGANTQAMLNNIDLSTGILDNVFDPYQIYHTASIDYIDQNISVAAYPADPCATLNINDEVTNNGEFSNPIALGEGSNLITINVDDGMNAKLYSLMVTRDSSAEYLQSTYIKYGSYFGKSVAVGTNTVVASASYDLVNIYTRVNSSVWNQQNLSVNNYRNYMGFGGSLALSGDTLAVGAPYREIYAYIPGSPQFTWVNAGSVYVYTLLVEGEWILQDTLIASDFYYSDEYGYSVAVDNETIVVGSPNKDSTGSNSGAVYIYKKDVNNNWIQDGYKVPTELGMHFGLSVALSGSNLAVGDEAGVYIYSIDELNPSTQFIYPLNASVSDYFGDSLSVSGDTLVIGAPGDDSDATGINGDEINNNTTNAGAVYIYVKDVDGQWKQQAYIKPSNTKQGMSFGHSVSLDGDLLAIGAFLEDSQSTGVNSDQMNINAKDSGAVYLYKRDATGVWTQLEYIKASNTDAGDQFGWSVGLSGGLLAIGAHQEDSGSYGINGDQADNSSDNKGAVYLFE